MSSEKGIDQGIQLLLNAEEDARSIVNKALEYRESAHESMLEKVEEEKIKMEAKLKAEYEAKFGDNGEDNELQQYTESLKQDADTEAKTIDNIYNQHKDVAVNVILHKATKINVEVGPALEQSIYDFDAKRKRLQGLA